jgi:hypothetical protein
MSSKVLASTSSPTQKATGKARFWAQVRRNLDFMPNLLTATCSMFLLAGSIVFLIYYIFISFMPEFDLKTSIVLPAVYALTGGFLLIVLGVCLPEMPPGRSYWRSFGIKI